MAGEEAILKTAEDYTIVRSAWLYGVQGKNFLKTLLKLTLQGKPLKVVNDQWGSLTWTHRLSQQINEIINKEAKGIFNATSEGFGTWYEVAKLFFELLKLDVDLTPCSTQEFPREAPRPKNSILENQALKAKGISCMKDWKEDLADFVHQYRDELFKEVA